MQARLSVKEEIVGSIRLGNSLSEYLGVIPLSIAIPLLVAAITDDTIVTWLIYGLSTIGLVLYWLSGYDLIRRTIKVPEYRIFVLIGIVGSSAFLIHGTVSHNTALSWTSLVVFMSLLSACAICHYSAEET